MYNQASIYKGGGVYKMGEASALPDNYEKPKRYAVVGDAVYADANGNVHFLVSSTINTSTLPSGWEFVGVVALREGNKATILHKNERSVRFVNCWLFKVTGLTFPLASSVSMVMQQASSVGTATVEVGTYTSSEGVSTLDDFVADFDDWLRDNTTASGALSNYNWHAEKMADAYGNDACFIVVDNADLRCVVSPIKSGSATASVYFWEYAGFNSDSVSIKRKDGVSTFSVIYNKARFKAYNTNINNPTDSLTTPGLFNEAGFEATTTVKNYYGTYDNYLDNMLPDEEATIGAFAIYKGLGKETADKLSDIKVLDVNGTESSLFAAEAYAASQKAHSTASVEGLNVGDWYIPGMDELYKILSPMKTDGSDPVNACFVAAGSSARLLTSVREIAARSQNESNWVCGSNGYYTYSFGSIITSNTACCIASYDVEE